MKKIYSVLGAITLGIFVSQSATAQLENSPSRNLPSKNPDKISDHQMLQKSGSGQENSVQALWDVRLSFDPTDQSGIPGWAGVVYAKGKFFCSKWNGPDTLAVFDSTGTFLELAVIPGIGAVRGMTFDGTNIWAGNNTRFVQVINPETYTKVRQCTVATTVGNVRWITFNPSGNSGAGSFYVGNFGTAIFQVRRPPANTANMASINSITAATHGLTGMYGVAYEDNGPNSKFWVFDQGQTESQAVIVQLDVNGVKTGVRRNVIPDAGSGAGSAGGMFIGNFGGFEGKTLVCLLQGVAVIAYDTRLAEVDALCDSIGTSNGYVAWPKNWSLATSFQGKVRANGNQALNSFNPVVKLTDLETSEVVEELAANPVSLPAGQTGNFTTSVFNTSLFAANTLYGAVATTNYPGDEVAANDTATSFFMLTDSTLARDYVFFANSLASSLGIGAAASEEKGLGVRFELPIPDTLTSVSYYLNSPVEGEASSVSIYGFEGDIPSIAPLVTTSLSYTATADDNTNGVLVTLFLDEPLPLPAGNFLVAVNELGDSICGIGTLALNYIPNTYFVKWNSNNAGQWSDLQNFPSGLRRAIAIYPNFGRRTFVTGNQGIGAEMDKINIYPNPATDKIYLNGLKENTSIRITDLSGRTLFSGKLNAADPRASVPLNVEFLAPGSYLLEAASGQERYTRKFIRN